MNEIHAILQNREKVLWEGKPKYAAYMIPIVFIALIVLAVSIVFIGASLLLGLIGIVIAVIIIVFGHLSHERIHYAITNKRVIFQSGIIGRDFKSVDYDKMQNVSVRVGLIGLMLKVGTVRIFTGEMRSVRTKHGHSIKPHYDRLVYVNKPYVVLKKLQSHLSTRKEKLYGGK